MLPEAISEVKTRCSSKLNAAKKKPEACLGVLGHTECLPEPGITVRILQMFKPSVIVS